MNVGVNHIALFLPTLDGGGGERVMINLARGFVDRGVEVDLVLVKAEGPLLARVPKEVNIVDLRASRVTRSLPALVRYLRHERPLALLSTSNHANLAAIIAKHIARVPTRAVVRQANTLSTRPQLSSKSKLVALLVRLLYRWADEIVAGSEGVAKDLAGATGLPIERIHVSANPIVTSELFAMAREPVEHPWLTAGKDPVILGVGRLAVVKDFATLIRAFAKIHERKPCRLVILGEGEERTSLETLISRLGLDERVALPGFVQNPFSYMARAAVFVLSSRSEGLPGALIQALACGAPVVATDCESGPREVLGGGRFGRLVPVGDVNALAEAVITVLASPVRKVPDEAWQRFTQTVAVDSYLRILGAVPNG